MRAYLSIFRLRLVSRLSYRAAALAGVMTQFFWGFIIIVVFLAFKRASPGATDMSDGQFASFVWLQQAFLTFVMLWFRDPELFELIVSGNVVYELVRPRGLYPSWFAKLAAQRLAAAALRCLPILAVAFFLPPPYRLMPPASPASAGLFAAALMIGLLIQVSISMYIYILTFITLNPYATMIFLATLGEFMAGMVIPVPLMPSWLRGIAMALPFRLVSDLPFRTYSGHIPPLEALAGIGQQVLWLAVLVAGGLWSMARVQRRATIAGG